MHTAAHEAAHVVQQQSGVKLAGGVGREGDPYEQHADRVADLVVAGESAVGALSEMASPAVSNQTAAVQLKRSKGKAGGKKDKGAPKKGQIINLKTRDDGSFRVEIDKGQEHGITPGTTCETSHAILTVVDSRESTSWATADSSLDSVKADLKVTNFSVPKEVTSRQEKAQAIASCRCDAGSSRRGRRGVVHDSNEERLAV